MNNKVLARIVAALVAVLMLGTMCFADSKDATVPENTTNTVKTVMAVASTTNTMPNPIPDNAIVYVAQYEDAYSGTITYDATRLAAVTDAEYIIVRFGGDKEVHTDVAVALEEAPAGVYVDFQKLTVVTEIAIGGTTYQNVIASEYNIPIYATTELDTFGVKYSKWTTDPTNVDELDDEDKLATHKTDDTKKVGIATFAGDKSKFDSSKLSGSGSVKFKTVIVGATDATDVEAFGYATYVDVTPES